MIKRPADGLSVMQGIPGSLSTLPIFVGSKAGGEVIMDDRAYKEVCCRVRCA